MADLIAQGSDSGQRWRRRLPPQKLVLGRDAGTWSVPWDAQISRRHLEVTWDGTNLHVKRLPEASNPVFLRGKEVGEFSLAAGEHFVVGETTFTVTEDQATIAHDAPQPVEEQAFSSQYLHEMRFRNAQQRIEVLNRLPDLIRGAASETELHLRLVNLLLAGIPRSDAVALVEIQQPDDAQADVHVLHWDRRLVTRGDFQPSQRLIAEAVRREQSLLHVWDAPEGAPQHSVTVSPNFDWAFCTPVPGEACRGWAIYVAGTFRLPSVSSGSPSESSDLRDDLKFTELVAAVLSSLREVQQLKGQQARLTPYFAPAVLSALADDPDAVQPREALVTVLFCDLRGFSREAERSAADLLGLLNRTSHALGVMTHHILQQGGVFGDFQGDAAMGFWGWPIRQEDAVARACRAALAIRAEFEMAARRPDDPMAGFRVGIGIATGTAVAGQIGTKDQVKVTVFGPVVNRASRLEGMTKLLHTPILLDEATAAAVRQQVGGEEARSRRLAVVRPYGMNWKLEVAELLPPESEYPALRDQHLAAYETALEALLAGDWTSAFEHLHEVPPQDRVKDFLTRFILQHNRTPPDDWDGVIPLASKG